MDVCICQQLFHAGLDGCIVTMGNWRISFVIPVEQELNDNETPIKARWAIGREIS